MAVGRDVVGNTDGADQISQTSRERCAPDAIGSSFQDMAKFTYCERTGQNTDAALMEFDMLRQKAEARMISGSGFPDEFVSVLLTKDAALPKNEKTLVLASLGNTLAIQSVSAQFRRLLGPCGYASRQDVVVAADMDTAPEEEDCEKWVAYRKAEWAKKDAWGLWESWGKQVFQGRGRQECH